MLDAVKVLFILTGASTYLVTKYVNIGINQTQRHLLSGDRYNIANEKKEEVMQRIDEEELRYNGTEVEPEEPLVTTYEVVVMEEDYDLPKKLLQIKALTIGQKSSSEVMYILSGDGVNEERPELSRFAINAFTGELFLIAVLDRDPPKGRALWTLNITAEDERGRRVEGWAHIKVKLKDINDNCPHFGRDHYWGKIVENNEKGEEIMRLSAHDSDQNDVIRYAIQMNRVDSSGQLIFDINELTGQLSAAVCCLDRETIGQYGLRVCATDGLNKTCTEVTVVVVDQNDETPHFSRQTIVVDMNARDLRSGHVITNLSVLDLDLVTSNRFSYKILNFSHFSKYFQIIAGNDVTTTTTTITTNTISDVTTQSVHSVSALLLVSHDFTLESELCNQEEGEGMGEGEREGQREGEREGAKSNNNNICDISLTIVVTDIGEEDNFEDESRLDFCSVVLRVNRSAIDDQKYDNRTEMTTNANLNVKSGSEVAREDEPTNTKTIWRRMSRAMTSIDSIVVLFGIFLFLIIFLLFLLIFFVKRGNRVKSHQMNGNDCDVRDGVRRYDSEGGECDQWAFDLSQLQVAVPRTAQQYLILSSAQNKSLLLPDVCTEDKNRLKIRQ